MWNAYAKSYDRVGVSLGDLCLRAFFFQLLPGAGALTGSARLAGREVPDEVPRWLIASTPSSYWAS